MKRRFIRASSVLALSLLVASSVSAEPHYDDDGNLIEATPQEQYSNKGGLYLTPEEDPNYVPPVSEPPEQEVEPETNTVPKVEVEELIDSEEPTQNEGVEWAEQNSNEKPLTPQPSRVPVKEPKPEVVEKEPEREVMYTGTHTQSNTPDRVWEINKNVMQGTARSLIYTPTTSSYYNSLSRISGLGIVDFGYYALDYNHYSLYYNMEGLAKLWNAKHPETDEREYKPKGFVITIHGSSIAMLGKFTVNYLVDRPGERGNWVKGFTRPNPLSATLAYEGEWQRDSDGDYVLDLGKTFTTSQGAKVNFKDVIEYVGMQPTAKLKDTGTDNTKLVVDRNLGFFPNVLTPARAELSLHDGEYKDDVAYIQVVNTESTETMNDADIDRMFVYGRNGALPSNPKPFVNPHGTIANVIMLGRPTMYDAWSFDFKPWEGKWVNNLFVVNNDTITWNTEELNKRNSGAMDLLVISMNGQVEQISISSIRGRTPQYSIQPLLDKPRSIREAIDQYVNVNMSNELKAFNITGSQKNSFFPSDNYVTVLNESRIVVDLRIRPREFYYGMATYTDGVNGPIRYKGLEGPFVKVESNVSLADLIHTNVETIFQSRDYITESVNTNKPQGNTSAHIYVNSRRLAPNSPIKFSLSEYERERKVWDTETERYYEVKEYVTKVILDGTLSSKNYLEFYTADDTTGLLDLHRWYDLGNLQADEPYVSPNTPLDPLIKPPKLIEGDTVDYVIGTGNRVSFPASLNTVTKVESLSADIFSDEFTWKMESGKLIIESDRFDYVGKANHRFRVHYTDANGDSQTQAITVRASFDNPVAAEQDTWTASLSQFSLREKSPYHKDLELQSSHDNLTVQKVVIDDKVVSTNLYRVVGNTLIISKDFLKTLPVMDVAYIEVSYNNGADYGLYLPIVDSEPMFDEAVMLEC